MFFAIKMIDMDHSSNLGVTRQVRLLHRLGLRGFGEVSGSFDGVDAMLILTGVSVAELMTTSA
ncbi:hypothetical protein HBH98_010000 [Parastagonospora nodorum]|nr:hypothetical protein HBH52_076600 [Parastagonospora nodorum]KAH4007461.1 hypothetical protein HBI10_005660 [Parastagonospora nodorum]KAH4023396.1 hypothetical protein HBI13_087370 [Parastagonospora nodorum]KAH4041093.1 hypothetical protein HBI09_017890 [Parastagonospora nodorum]KAH4086375.1 hypothetical protein HBH46_205860 [Parastagonospora nodorum]